MREKKSTLSFFDLPFLECKVIENDSCALYMVVVRIEDYGKLLSDNGGRLRRDLFDADGWDFLWTNQTNEEIACVLADPAALWQMSTSVTIIATNATVLGNIIRLQDIQIINGLRTTRIVYHYFQDGSATSEDRELFVQIIVTPDEQARDQIIRATSIQGRRLTAADLQAARFHHCRCRGK